MIIGRWRSEDDKKDELVFTKENQLDYYDKKLELISNYQIRHDSLIVSDEGRPLYYIIENLTSTYLSLMYLNNGKIFLFKREKTKNINSRK